MTEHTEKEDKPRVSDNASESRGDSSGNSTGLQRESQQLREAGEPPAARPNTAEQHLPGLSVERTANPAVGDYMSNNDMVAMWDKAVADKGQPLSVMKGYYEAGVHKVDPVEHPNGLIISSSESPMTFKNDITVKFADGSHETIKAGSAMPNGYQVSPTSMSAEGETRTVGAGSRLTQTSGDGSVIRAGEITDAAVIEKGQIARPGEYVVSRPSMDLDTGKPRIDTYTNKDLSRWVGVPGKDGIYSPNLETAKPIDVIQVPKGYQGTFDVSYGGTAPLKPGDLIVREEKTLPDGSKQPAFRRISELDALETYRGVDSATQTGLAESEKNLRAKYPDAPITRAASAAEEFHVGAGKSTAAVHASTSPLHAPEHAGTIGKLGKLGTAGLALGPVLAGSAVLLGGGTKAEAAIAAADTVVPATPALEGRKAETIVKGVEMAMGFNPYLPPIAGAALGAAITDVPRQLLRSKGYDVDPSTTEQFKERLKTEYSVSEVRDGLRNPETAISKQFTAAYDADYNKLVAEAGGNTAGLPTREKFVQEQIREYLKNMSGGPMAASLGKVPSGIARL